MSLIKMASVWDQTQNEQNAQRSNLKGGMVGSTLGAAGTLGTLAVTRGKAKKPLFNKSTAKKVGLGAAAGGTVGAGYTTLTNLSDSRDSFNRQVGLK